jgi:hypothetical protein
VVVAGSAAGAVELGCASAVGAGCAVSGELAVGCPRPARRIRRAAGAAFEAGSLVGVGWVVGVGSVVAARVAVGESGFVMGLAIVVSAA